MKPTLNDIRAFEQYKKDELERIKLCLTNSICPTCGADIVVEKVEKLDQPRRYFFGLLKTDTEYWSSRTICEKDKSHFEWKWRENGTLCGEEHKHILSENEIQIELGKFKV